MATPVQKTAPSQTPEPDTEPTARRGLTARSVMLGLVGVVAMNVIAVYVPYDYQGSLMTYTHVPMAMLIVFVLMVICGAAFSRWTGIVLSTTEWHTILAMGIVAAAVPGYGLTTYLLALMAAPHYYPAVYRSSTAPWETFLYPYTKDWLFPSNEGNAVSWFHEGLPPGAEIPWDVWVVPLFSWGTMIAAFFLTLACVAAILRKQWLRNERLVFPATVPLVDMAAHPGSGRRALPEFTKHFLFRVGFCISFGMIAWNCISYFILNFPRFPIGEGDFKQFSEEFPNVMVSLDLYTLFFSYFASLDVLFSLWFFDLVYILEAGGLHALGVDTRPVSGAARGVIISQTMGAYAVFALSVFWVARGHIRDVFRKALNRDAPVDDQDQLLSYRTVVIGLIVGLVFMFLWLTRIGYEAVFAALVLPIVILVYVGMARMVADSGMPFLSIPRGVSGFGYVGRIVGRDATSASTLVAHHCEDILFHHFRGLFLPALAHAGRIAEGVRGNRRHLMAAVVLAFFVSLFLSVTLTLDLAYRKGAHAFNSWMIGDWASRHLRNAAQSVSYKFKNPSPPIHIRSPDHLAFLTIGGAAMAGLTYLRHTFFWWPLHPLGLALVGAELVRRTSTTLFLAWLIKLLMLRVGGQAVYQKSFPLFLGLLVGYVLGVAFSGLIDAIWFPYQAHPVHTLGWYDGPAVFHY